MPSDLKRIFWEGDSKKELLKFSEGAQDDLGYELHLYKALMKRLNDEKKES